MQRIKDLLTGEDRGVSPVIGVILMVAITVILAAVIATFVIGLGDSTNSAQPNISLDYNYENNNTGDVSPDDYDRVTISVDSVGSTDIDPSNIKISDGSPVTQSGQTLDSISTAGFGSTISAGDEVVLEIDDSSGGDEIELIYETDDSSDILDTSTVPEL